MVSNNALRSEVQRFFDAFVSAFREFDGNLIAQRYAAPYLSLNAASVLQQFNTQEETGRYFQRIVDQYHLQGCRTCRFNDLEVTSLGSNCALASVTWELLRSDGSIISAWRESYNLMRTSDGFRIFASIDHDPLMQ